MTGHTPRELGYRMPAEWERQDAVWLAWPHNADTWRGTHVLAVRETYIETMRVLADEVRVCLLVNDEEAERDVRARLIAAGVEPSSVALLQIPTRDTWIRDYGPTFVVSDATRTVAMVKWEFNAWGGKYEDLKADNCVPYEMNRRLGLPIFEAGLVLEGGSIDVNGAGAALTTEQCLLHTNRNAGLTREDIEARLREFLGVTTVIWLGDGIAGDDTDGHIDDVARFIDERTIVCAVEEDPADVNFRPLADNRARLARARDESGRGFDVIDLPMPHATADAVGRLPASYANFLISNRSVLVPTFNCGTDARALDVLSRCFPSRRVIGIDSREMVAGLGAIHCCSQQQPRAPEARE